MTIKIRSIRKKEIHMLEVFLYEAIFQKDNQNPLPKEIIKDPQLNVFIKDFGKKDDFCLVAHDDEMIIGAVWTRVIAGDIKGYGHIDDQTPEFAISILKPYRNMGVGSKLMKAMLDLLKSKGYKQTSLAVQKENFAYLMYEKLGFKIVKETDEEYIMICQLNESRK